MKHNKTRMREMNRKEIICSGNDLNSNCICKLQKSEQRTHSHSTTDDRRPTANDILMLQVQRSAQWTEAMEVEVSMNEMTLQHCARSIRGGGGDEHEKAIVLFCSCTLEQILTSQL